MSRSARAASWSDGWVLPVGAGARLPLTPVGTLDGRGGTRVDPRGLVETDGWSLDWWVGADDRWHLPSREPSVRQSLLDDAPVVETRLRVPSGDAVHRAYGARDPQGHEHVVVEVENASTVPFALALVLRPFDAQGRPSDVAGFTLSPVGHGGTADPHLVWAGGRLAAVLPRRPARAAGATGWVDVVDEVTAGRAGDDLAGSADGSGPTAALVFPVPHRTTLRILLPQDPDRDLGQLEGIPAVPPADLVASGWRRLAGRGVQIDVPDSGVAAGVRACRAHLLLGDGADDAARIAALDAEGLHDEADRILTGLHEAPTAWRRMEPRAASTLLEVAARHRALTRDDQLAARMLPVLSVLARRAAKAGTSGAPAMEGFAQLLEGIGQPEAAAAVRPAPFTRARPTRRWERVDELRRSASPTWCWAEAGRHDVFLAAVRDVLFEEDAGSLAVLPDGAGPWARLPVELHRAPTGHGPFSFAVRWHGARPALLWELEAHPGAGPVLVRAPGLDPSWSTDEPSGEALLAAPAPPRGDDGAPPDPGGSFT